MATTSDVFESCTRGAKSDRSLGLAKCDNQPDAATRKACNKQALADAKDAVATCGDERDGRQAACAKLGAAPYHPAIVYTNFVATLDNHFFPHVPGTTFVYEVQTPTGSSTTSSPSPTTRD
jgi:hypothetical protein